MRTINVLAVLALTSVDAAYLKDFVGDRVYNLSDKKTMEDTNLDEEMDVFNKKAIQQVSSGNAPAYNLA